MLFKWIWLAILGFNLTAQAKTPTLICDELLLESQNLPKSFQHQACENFLSGTVPFNILSYQSSPNCSHNLVFVGENHLSPSFRREATYELIRGFQVRGLENAWDLDKIRDSKQLADSVSGRPKNPPIHSQPNDSLWQRLMNYLKEGVGSPSYDLNLDPGIYFSADPDKTFSVDGTISTFALRGPNEESDPLTKWSVLLKYLGQGSASKLNNGCRLDELKSLETIRRNPERFLEIMRPLLQTGMPSVNIDVEYGELSDYSNSCKNYGSADCMGYVLTKRNHRLVNNVRNLITRLPCGMPMVLILGEAHIGPATRDFEKLGFVEVNKEFSASSYRRYGHDPEWPND